MYDAPDPTVAFSRHEPLKKYVQLALGVELLLAVLLFDALTDSRGLASEGPPILSFWYLVRSGVLLAASALLIVPVRALAEMLPFRRRIQDAAWDGLAAAGGSIVALGAAALVLANPEMLSRAVREDYVVEWLSAILAFAAAILFGVTAYRRRGHRTLVPSLLFTVMGGACLLLGLEEVSWFQRVLDIESPTFMINRNGQQELNLHNLATDFSGNVYYVGAFGYSILLPGLLGDRQLPTGLRSIQPLIPPRLVLYGSAPAVALVHEMWNVMWIQLTFWMTVVFLVLDMRTSRRQVASAVAAATIVTALVFITAGDEMIRSWDDTEVRELIIPYGLALAGLCAVSATLRPGWTDPLVNATRR